VDKFFCSIRLPSVATRKEADQLPNPILLAEVKKTHKGKHLPGTSWTVVSGVHPLEDQL